MTCRYLDNVTDRVPVPVDALAAIAWGGELGHTGLLVSVRLHRLYLITPGAVAAGSARTRFAHITLEMVLDVITYWKRLV